MRVLVVEDDPAVLLACERALLDQGYDVNTASNGSDAFREIQRNDHRLVIADWEMPGIDGLQLCQMVRNRTYGAYVYFILITGRRIHSDLVDALNAGADDFIRKPFAVEELHSRLQSAERITKLDTRDAFVKSMTKLAASRDDETGTHLKRMREYSRVLAEQLSTVERFGSIVDDDYIRAIYVTSPLHDIGKVGIPDHILCKPGKLTDEEFAVMKTHALIGAQTLEAASKNHPDDGFYRVAKDIALSHHEKFNGQGYPHGLAGQKIPLCARIVALADVYDALTTKRVYKPAFSHDKARQIIMDDRGTHFDPDVVDAFLACEQQFQDIRNRLDEQSTKETDQGHEDRGHESIPRPRILETINAGSSAMAENS